MEDKDKILDEIFSNDPLGLLEVKLKSSNARTADERLSASFEEINSFYEKNNRAPEPNTENISEYQLYSRLKGIREDENKYLMLEPQDKYDLLKVEKKEINSIDDIFGDDLLGIFSDGEEHSLFEFKHTPRELARAEADFIARRKPCKNFRDYEGLFKNVQDDLATGKRKLIPFKETQLKPGNFYINNGVLLYLESIDYQGRMWKRGEAENNRIREFKDGRTNTIFENGTMSNMLFRSLAKTLILNGKSVTENSNIVGENIISGLSNVSELDKESGYIYVLSSKSTNPKISSINNLYKIGYSTTTVDERIKNAERQPTYLMAPVEIVAVYKAFNMNAQKFEQLLHNFFGTCCLNIDIYDEKLRRKAPQEWFVVPLSIIDEAINYIITEEIVHYRYDSENKEIVLR